MGAIQHPKIYSCLFVWLSCLYCSVALLVVLICGGSNFLLLPLYILLVSHFLTRVFSSKSCRLHLLNNLLVCFQHLGLCSVAHWLRENVIFNRCGTQSLCTLYSCLIRTDIFLFDLSTFFFQVYNFDKSLMQIVLLSRGWFGFLWLG